MRRTGEPASSAISGGSFFVDVEEEADGLLLTREHPAVSRFVNDALMHDH
jgi:hypothetical protein